MFSIVLREPGEVVLTGWFDASRVDEANTVFDKLTDTTRVNMKDLEYISSLGLGVLLKTQKRLNGGGKELILAQSGKLVRDVFRIARFEHVFKMEDAK